METSGNRQPVPHRGKSGLRNIILQSFTTDSASSIKSESELRVRAERETFEGVIERVSENPKMIQLLGRSQLAIQNLCF